jgi:hypothetical protein
VGKTALVEALSLTITHKPHRSPVTVPAKGATLAEKHSTINLDFELSREELFDLLANYYPRLYVPIAPSMNQTPLEAQVNGFNEKVLGEQNLSAVIYRPGIIVSAYLIDTVMCYRMKKAKINQGVVWCWGLIVFPGSLNC